MMVVAFLEVPLRTTLNKTLKSHTCCLHAYLACTDTGNTCNSARRYICIECMFVC